MGALWDLRQSRNSPASSPIITAKRSKRFHVLCREITAQDLERDPVLVGHFFKASPSLHTRNSGSVREEEFHRSKLRDDLCVDRLVRILWIYLEQLEDVLKMLLQIHIAILVAVEKCMEQLFAENKSVPTSVQAIQDDNIAPISTNDTHPLDMARTRVFVEIVDTDWPAGYV